LEKIMKTLRKTVDALCILALMGSLGGCTRLKAKTAYKDGNRYYSEENYKKAVDEYKKATTLDPNLAEAHFYLASSHQLLYRPGKEGAENLEHLEAAIAEYLETLRVNKAETAEMKKLRNNTLAALVQIYSDAPKKDFGTAFGYADELVRGDRESTPALFAMANLYEKFEKVAEAEAAYKKVFDKNPQDAKICSALAGFYNKTLWGGKARFDEAVTTLEKCAGLEPENPAGYYKVAQYYWDKAYRDRELNDEQKDAIADRGLKNVNIALDKKADYVDALVYKGLLLRVKAQVTRNPRLRLTYLDQAIALQKQAQELKKEQAQAATAQQPPAAE
jgi:tetratricopeptide (TPR) repeat protein